MKYIFAKWLHSDADEPYLLYSEVDDELWEVRKIEIYRNGRKGWADDTEEVGDTFLGTIPLPPLEEIFSDPEFETQEITREEFERAWAQRKNLADH